jgi:hypothetical protein
MATLLAAVGVLALVVVSITQLGQPAYALDAYPVETLGQLDDWKVDLEEVRLASIDRVGNLIELRDGPGRRVFFDDRFDMYPDRVSSDALELTVGGPRWARILDRWDIDLVLWPKSNALASIVGSSPDWRVLFDEERAWALYCRVGVPLGGDLGTC